MGVVHPRCGHPDVRFDIGAQSSDLEDTPPFFGAEVRREADLRDGIGRCGAARPSGRAAAPTPRRPPREKAKHGDRL